jgi:hypothetical protein
MESQQQSSPVGVFIGPYATFAHLFLAAFLAILLRCFAFRLAALAIPPLDAPSFDSATAAGFFTRVSHFSPVTFSMSDLAERIGSLWCFFLSLLAREGMVRLWHKNQFYDPQNGNPEQQ